MNKATNISNTAIIGYISITVAMIHQNTKYNRISKIKQNLNSKSLIIFLDNF